MFDYIKRTPVDQTEMYKLRDGLTERNIPFTMCDLWGGKQIICDDWDVICHCGSYGHELGLLETMGLPINDCAEDDVVGSLTAEDILNFLDTRG